MSILTNRTTSFCFGMERNGNAWTWSQTKTGSFFISILVTICKRNEFKCQNGRCVSVNLICNQVNDCYDNSDENYCCSGFLCDNERCIKKEERCDTLNQCGDWSDEKHCAGWFALTSCLIVWFCLFALFQTPKMSSNRVKANSFTSCVYLYFCNNSFFADVVL